MGEETAIAWTTATANFWMGCEKISPGCKNCYAESLTRDRMGLSLWGPAYKTKRKPVAKVYKMLERMQRDAASGVLSGPEPGVAPLVFVNSLSDWAERHPDLSDLRARLWDTIRACPDLHFQLLTKRADLIEDFLPPDWNDWSEGYPNVWLGVSIENSEYLWRLEELRKIRAVVRFVSYEPALGPLHEVRTLAGLDWMIYGGESGKDFRAEGIAGDPQLWSRQMQDRCERDGVVYFHKQSAARRTEMGVELDGRIVRNYPTARRSERFVA